MAETVKKTSAKPKAPAKPRKNAAAKEPASENGTHTGSNGTPAIVTQMKYSHEQVAQLAHRYWAERGGKHGHHEEDWFRAEQELRARAS
ncbi:MAG TPA: DUF2934 domain-containing protein [Terracidiphilus sp.]